MPFDQGQCIRHVLRDGLLGEDMFAGRKSNANVFRLTLDGQAVIKTVRIGLERFEYIYAMMTASMSDRLTRSW